MTHKHPLLIFDLDGTLVDSKIDISISLAHALQKHGFASPPQEALVKTIGRPLSDAFLFLEPKCANQLDDLIQTYRDYYAVHNADHSRPFPHVVAMLARLPHAKAIATTKKPDVAISLLQKLKLDAYFELIQGTEDYMPAKPDPTILNLILNQLHFAPHETYMIGDTRHDIHAGINAGTKTVGVLWGNDAEGIIQSNPDFLLHKSIEELEPIIKMAKEA